MVLDVRRERVTRGDEEIALAKLSFDVFAILVRCAPDLVSVDALMAQAWPGLVVSPETVSQRIKLVRQALGDDSKQPRYIAGVRGRGYRIISDVRPLDQSKSSPTSGEPRLAAPRSHTSIAILPFANLTGDSTKEYLGDGIAEELINTLTRAPGWFKVAARTSAFAYKGRHIDVRQIAHDLDVEAVLEGSVLSADERIRITAQLVDGRTGHHLWSRSYERKFADWFDLQGELTVSIADALAIWRLWFVDRRA